MTPKLSSRHRRALRLTTRFLAPYRWQVIGALLALIVTAAVTLSMGQGIKLLVDRGFMTQSPHQLNQSIGIFMLMVLGLAVGTFARFYWVSWIGERCVADIRREVFNHLVYLHPGFYENNRSSEIQSRLTADTTLLQSVIGSSLSMFLRNLLMVIGGVVLLFVTNAKLTSIVVIALPFVVAPILIFGRRVRNLSRLSQDRVADIGSYVSETLGQIKTVQAYNHQVQDEQRFATTVEDAFDTARKRIFQRSWMITMVIVLVLGAVAVMLWVGGMDVIAGRITGGELAAFVFYSLIVGSAIGTLSEVIGELQRAAGAAERIAELLGSENIIQPPTTGLVTLPERVRGELQLQDVRFSYPSRPESYAVNGLNLTIRAGETLALVGPSGAGKSTVYDLLLRFYDPRGRADPDRWRAADQPRPAGPAPSLSPWSRNRRRCFSAASKTTSVTAARAATLEQVKEAAKIAHAHDFIEKMPHGYQTHLGDGWPRSFRRPASASGDRSGVAGRRADPAAGRSHQRPRCAKRTPDSGSAAEPDAQPHHAGDRASSGHREKR